MSVFDTHPESLGGESDTLQSQRVWKSAGQQDLDFESQRLRNRLRAKMFGVDASPVSIGRYKVLETVGSGGMGVVYSAYDDQLDRKVAVKLLRPSREEDASVGKTRLLREAQALAKLSHPHVVQIYEVGTFNGRVFLAMEFLPGPNLRAWLVDGPRPWDVILQRYVEAGRGLAAAHAEGIIHRDFKPANLLFGSDGGVRVVDFGLARATGAVGAVAGELEVSELSGHHAFEVELTQTGEIMGTPAYMSPEQARHDPVDERSDQYSFCVALYEALFGRRPHSGDSTTEVLMAVADGRVDDPPRNTKVPARVVRAVMRGLAADPGERFPSMDALLAELAPERSGGRWRWLGGGAVALAGVGMVLGSSPTPCSDLHSGLQAPWTAERRDAVAAAFVASGVPSAEQAMARVDEQLGDYSAQWLDARQDACEAHLVRHEQSAERHDQRVTCLLERRAELDSLTQAFTSADASLVELAPRAVTELSSIEGCAQPAHLAARGSDDPAWNALRVSLAEAQAVYKAGRHAPALAALDEVAARAHELGAQPIEAAAIYHRGVVHHRRRACDGAVESLQRATELAEIAGDDALAARSWIALTRARLTCGGTEAAEDDIRMARAKVERLGDDGVLRLDLRGAGAAVAWRAERLDEAIDEQAAVVDGYRERLGEHHPKASDALLRLASMLGDHGRHDEAQLRYRQAREALVHAHGEVHPRVADVDLNIAIDLRAAGRTDEVRPHLLAAERIYVRTQGPEAPSLIQVHMLLAELALDEDLDEAERRAEQMLELASAEGVGGTSRLDALALLANIATERNEPAKGVEHCRAYLAQVESLESRDDHRVSALYTRQLLAELLLELGRFADAQAEARRVLEQLEPRKDAALDPLRSAAREVLAGAAKADVESTGV